MEGSCHRGCFRGVPFRFTPTVEGSFQEGCFRGVPFRQCKGVTTEGVFLEYLLGLLPRRPTFYLVISPIGRRARLKSVLCWISRDFGRGAEESEKGHRYLVVCCGRGFLILALQTETPFLWDVKGFFLCMFVLFGGDVMLGSTLSLDVSVAVSCVRTCNNPCVSQYCVYHCVIVG